MSRRQQIAVLIALVISAGFLWVAFRDLKPGDVIDIIADANFALLALGALVYFGAVAVISLRWQFLVRAVTFIPLRRLIPLVCIGYMGNNVYPFRSGEALRIYLLYRNDNVPVVKGATTVLVERVFDGLVMLTFIVVPLLFVEIASDEIQQVARFAAPVFLIALALFLVLAAQPDILRRLVRIASQLAPGKVGDVVTHISEDIIDGLEGLRSPLHLAGTTLTSYLCWAIEAGVYWIVGEAFGLQVGYPVMLVVVGTVNLAGLIPASPGQIGVFEFFVAAVLVGAGIEETLAASYALTVHIVIWLPVTLVGFFFLARQGIGWQAITRARDLEEEATAST